MAGTTGGEGDGAPGWADVCPWETVCGLRGSRGGDEMMGVRLWSVHRMGESLREGQSSSLLRLRKSDEGERSL